MEAKYFGIHFEDKDETRVWFVLGWISGSYHRSTLGWNCLVCPEIYTLSRPLVDICRFFRILGPEGAQFGAFATLVSNNEKHGSSLDFF